MTGSGGGGRREKAQKGGEKRERERMKEEVVEFPFSLLVKQFSYYPIFFFTDICSNENQGHF